MVKGSRGNQPYTTRELWLQQRERERQAMLDAQAIPGPDYLQMGLQAGGGAAASGATQYALGSAAGGGSGAAAGAATGGAIALGAALTADSLYSNYEDLRDEGWTEDAGRQAIAQGLTMGAGWAPYMTTVNDQTEDLTGLNRQDIDNTTLATTAATNFYNPLGWAAMAHLAADAAGMDLDFSSGKTEDQQRRDSVRDRFRQAGLVGLDDYDLLGFDIGRDGSERLANIGSEALYEGDLYSERANSGERFVHEWDPTDERAAEAIALVNPLAAILGGQEGQAEAAGWMVNAALQSEDPLEAIREMYRELGLSKEEFSELLDDVDWIDDEERRVYNLGRDRVWGDADYDESGWNYALEGEEEEEL